MFEGLDSIEWAALEHAYGPATDVPDQLRALASGDDTTVESALDDFFSNIYHQGTVYPASVMAVPYLVEALDVVGPDHLATLLYLLQALAEGHGYFDVHQHAGLAQPILDRMDTSESVIDGERTVVGSTTRAVFNHWDAYEALLDHERRGVRISALDLLVHLALCDVSAPASPEEPLAYLGVRPRGSTQGVWHSRLKTRLARMEIDSLEEIESAAVLKAICTLEPSAATALLDRELRAFERYVVLQRLADETIKRDGHLPDSLARDIAGLAAEYDHLIACQFDPDWTEGGRVEHWMLPTLACAGDDVIEEIAPTIVSVIEKAHSISFDETMSAALLLALGRPAPEIAAAAACSLPSGRKAIAEAVVRKHDPANILDLWSPSSGNASLVFSRMGVTRDRATWMAWLGIASEAPSREAFRLRWPWRK